MSMFGELFYATRDLDTYKQGLTHGALRLLYDTARPESRENIRQHISDSRFEQYR